MGATHYFGKMCAKHPELKGERYLSRGCTACVKARGRKVYGTPEYRARDAKRRRSIIYRKQKAARGLTPEYRAYQRAWHHKQRSTNPVVRLIESVRARLGAMLRGKNKSASTFALLGVESAEQYQVFLETQFEPGMTWENYGTTWHIDHRIPLSLLDLSKPENQRFGFNYQNTRPMWAKANISRGNKLVFEDLL